MAQGQGVNPAGRPGRRPDRRRAARRRPRRGRRREWSLRAVHVRDPRGAGADAALDGIDLTDVELIETEGAPVAGIERLVAAGADAVAFGARARPAPASAAWPSLCWAPSTCRCSSCGRASVPVERLRRIVVPLEGSPSASVAMKHADDAFCARGREIVMLHVSDERRAYPNLVCRRRLMDQEHYEWKAWQEEFTMRFSQCVEGGAAPRLGARRRPADGDPPRDPRPRRRARGRLVARYARRGPRPGRARPARGLALRHLPGPGRAGETS